MSRNRIYFPGNPWAAGHGIACFEWDAEVRDGMVWFLLHLESDYYYAEEDIDDLDREYDSDWEAPIVWSNYHRCTISSTEWHDGGFIVCPQSEYSLEYLHGHKFLVDSEPNKIADEEEFAFWAYLLGHDSVAQHRIKFTQRDNNYFDLDWRGKIALTYSGDEVYRYDFIAQIYNVEAPLVAS